MKRADLKVGEIYEVGPKTWGTRPGLLLSTEPYRTRYGRSSDGPDAPSYEPKIGIGASYSGYPVLVLAGGSLNEAELLATVRDDTSIGFIDPARREHTINGRSYTVALYSGVYIHATWADALTRRAADDEAAKELRQRKDAAKLVREGLRQELRAQMLRLSGGFEIGDEPRWRDTPSQTFEVNFDAAALLDFLRTLERS